MNTTKIEAAIDILQKYISTAGIAYIQISGDFTIHCAEMSLNISLSLQELNAILRSSYAAKYGIEFHPNHIAIMIENEKNVNVVCEHIKQYTNTQPFDIYVKHVNGQFMATSRLCTHDTHVCLYTNTLGKDYEMSCDINKLQKYVIRKVGVKYPEDLEIQDNKCFDFLPENKLEGYVCKFSEKSVLEAFINRMCDTADKNCSKGITRINTEDSTLLLINYNLTLSYQMICQLNAIFRAKGFTESYMKYDVIYLRRSKHFCENMHCNPLNMPRNMWEKSEYHTSDTLTSIYKEICSAEACEFAGGMISKMVGSHADKVILAKKKIRSAGLKLDEVIMLRNKAEKNIGGVKAKDTEIESNEKRKRLAWYTEQLGNAEKEKKEADDELDALMKVDSVEVKVDSVDKDKSSEVKVDSTEVKDKSSEVKVESVNEIEQMLKEIDADLENHNRHIAVTMLSKVQLLNKIKEIKDKEKMSAADKTILDMIPDAK
jgi:hypothetical protein